MANNYLITWMLIQTVILLIACFKIFSKSYFQEKGKNLATKEDIGDITIIVEKIKADLSSQNEILKNNLSLQSEHKINLRASEREALINYFKSTKQLTSVLKRFDFSNYNENNYKDLELIDQKFETLFLEWESDEALLILYYQSSALNDTHYRLTHLFNKMRSLIFFAKIDIVLEYDLYNIENPTLSTERLELYKQMRETILLRIKKYSDDLLILYEDVLKQNNSLVAEIRKRLNELGDL